MSAASKLTPISSESSTKICRHMNDDHPASVYAMARKVIRIQRGWKLSDARIKSIDNYACHLQAITCSGDLCEMNKIQYSFDPPLQSAEEARQRLVQIHHTACAPPSAYDFFVQRTPFVAGPILIACLAMAYGTLVMGPDEIVALLEDRLSAVPGVERLFFGSFPRFASLTVFFFWFTVLAHGLEAAYGVVHARTTLKLTWYSSLHWGFWIFLLGFAALGELQPLIRTASKTRKN